MSELIQRPFWYLRHGETDWNYQGFSQGRTDVPLNTTGLIQATRAGEIFAKLFENNQRPFDRIITSPLSRALVTAQYTQAAILNSGGPNLPLTIDPDLQEVSFGVQEGQPMGEWYDPWIAGKFTPEGAESFDDLKNRSISALNKELIKGGTPLFVAHGGLFRGIRAAMNLAVNVRLPNASPTYLSFHAGEWSVQNRVA
ncbi:histidine phosphatase family protein [Swingsia samuiensis]|uniref:Histidine phosphatase family protein n=1 Tax=Swingsia samuiensis TaxID=1293412 RepID=A0A4Y6UIG8_9PROT|nr:histidine phosphatase family protein [Swingsia samuiensis]QDH16854.1 histidine phosphatase family protein [Swingsia samuiensis]